MEALRISGYYVAVRWFFRTVIVLALSSAVAASSTRAISAILFCFSIARIASHALPHSVGSQAHQVAERLPARLTPSLIYV